MIVVDTSVLLAYFHARDPAHDRVAELFDDASLTYVVSPMVVAELDYLVTTRLGVAAELQMLRELTSGAYEMPSLSLLDLLDCQAIIERHAPLPIGVTDASLVVLADRYETVDIATFDRRHFSVLRRSDGAAFRLLP